ncbi:carB, partial [Symbiodinium sp. KB8]
MGGQTALNCALDLQEMGVLEKYGVEMIGARADVIEKAEDREKFRAAMDAIGLENPRAAIASSPAIRGENGKITGYDRNAGYLEAMRALDEIGLPAIIRPAFTLGGTGGGVAYNREEYETIVRSGIDASPVGQVLIDESLLGWKEYEMEVVRDKIMRDASIAVLREIGVETGGSNVQFAVNPIPRFAFEKFPGSEPSLTTAMKSVGEVMAIGRTFQESLQKALRGLETGLNGLDETDIPGLDQGDDRNALRAAVSTATPTRLLSVAQAMRLGMSVEEVHQASGINTWFLEQMEDILAMEAKVRNIGLPQDASNLRKLKSMGFSDARLASLAGVDEADVARLRRDLGVHPVYKRIDTC